MKLYKFILKEKSLHMYAPNNRLALKQAGTFAIKEDDGIKSLIREDGEVVI